MNHHRICQWVLDVCQCVSWHPEIICDGHRDASQQPPRLPQMMTVAAIGAPATRLPEGTP